MFIFALVFLLIGAFTGLLSVGITSNNPSQTDTDQQISVNADNHTESAEESQNQRSNIAPTGTLFVDTNSQVATVVNRLENEQLKAQLQPIVQTPSGIWQTYTSDLAVFAKKIQTARESNTVPIVVLYNIPNIGCGSQGARTLDEYKAWIDERATVLNKSSAIVIIEPDAIAFFDCLTATQLEIRKEALNYAVDKMVATGSSVYLDAGHSQWVDAATMSQRLLESGLARTRGISVNVSNYQTNESSEIYAQKVLELSGLGHLGAVIDTSRNGNGPAANQQWCNAQGMRLGTPSKIAKNGVIDAYLWIKVPGESDGTGPICSNSPVAEGEFWLEYALSLL